MTPPTKHPARAAYDWRKPSRTATWRRDDSKVSKIWATMLRRNGAWTAGSVAKAAGATDRFTRSYIRALVAYRYVRITVPGAGARPPHYELSGFYTEALAPQLAGGSGGGGRLGNGWNPAPELFFLVKDDHQPWRPAKILPALPAGPSLAQKRAKKATRIRAKKKAAGGRRKPSKAR